MSERLLKDLESWAQEQSEITALYLYGSLCEKRAAALSDIDIAVLIDLKISKPQSWRLEDQWLAQWPEPVDLRVLNYAPLTFRFEVTARGKRIWAADLGMVAEIESLIWRQYWDMRPKLEQDWNYFVEYLTEKRSEAERQQYQTALAKVRSVHRRVREATAGRAGSLQE